MLSFILLWYTSTRPIRTVLTEQLDEFRLHEKERSLSLRVFTGRENESEY